MFCVASEIFNKDAYIIYIVENEVLNKEKDTISILILKPYRLQNLIFLELLQKLIVVWKIQVL